jgi:hypothetical protein
MAYITYGELLSRYPIVKRWHDGQASMVNSFCIFYAEKQLDSLLGTHFSVPFSAAHPTIKDLTFDICYYRILLDSDPTKAADFYTIILDRIDGIKNGDEYILTDSGTIAPDAAGLEVKSNTEDYHPVHSMLDADSIYTQVSSAQLYDEEDARD